MDKQPSVSSPKKKGLQCVLWIIQIKRDATLKDNQN